MGRFLEEVVVLRAGSRLPVEVHSFLERAKSQAVLHLRFGDDGAAGLQSASRPKMGAAQTGRGVRQGKHKIPGERNSGGVFGRIAPCLVG